MGGTAPTPDLVIPDSMALDARFAMDGPQLTATLGLAEQQGRLHLDAAYHLGTEAYRAHLDVDSLQLDHFMPRDSLRLLSLRAEAAGQGTDPASPLTTAALDASLRRLEYARRTVSGVDVKASLARALAKAHVVSDNALLKMEAVGTMRLDTRHTDGHLQLRADDVALHRLGITPEPLPNPCAFTLSAAARHDSVHLSFDSGDLHARLKGGTAWRHSSARAPDLPAC